MAEGNSRRQQARRVLSWLLGLHWDLEKIFTFQCLSFSVQNAPGVSENVLGTKA